MEKQLQLESPPPVTSENQFMITHVHTFQKTKIMASGSITSWQMDGETMETVTDSKITADGDFSHEIKRHLLFGRKAMTNIDSILKSRDFVVQKLLSLIRSHLFIFAFISNSWEVGHTESCCDVISPQNNEFHFFLKGTWNFLQDRSHLGP